MYSKSILGLFIFGITLLPLQPALATEDKIKSLQPIPYTPQLKERKIIVLGDQAYEVDARGKRTLLADGEYDTANGMIIIVGGKVASPRDAASGLATGKRQHKPIHISAGIEKRGLNPQPLPPKSTGFLENDVANKGLNPQPEPPTNSASGLPTGKRQHKPVSITKPVDQAGSDPLSKQGLNPQPLPPKSSPASSLNAADAKMLNPQPLPPKEVDRMDQMKLQQHMDAKNKAASTTSSISKKQSDTSNAIIQNIK